MSGKTINEDKVVKVVLDAWDRMVIVSPLGTLRAFDSNPSGIEGIGHLRVETHGIV